MPFFFDVDGTLAAIQSQPDAVFIPENVVAELQRLSSLCHGALALVSGRPVEQLDALAAPLRHRQQACMVLNGAMRQANCIG